MRRAKEDEEGRTHLEEAAVLGRQQLAEAADEAHGRGAQRRWLRVEAALGDGREERGEQLAHGGLVSRERLLCRRVGGALELAAEQPLELRMERARREAHELELLPGRRRAAARERLELRAEGLQEVMREQLHTRTRSRA